MFVFLEGSHYPVQMPIDQNILIRREIVEETFNFQEAIRFLVDRSHKDPKITTVITNFFTVGCAKLPRSQVRGLERIAHGEGAFAVCTDEGVKKARIKSIVYVHPGDWQPEDAVIRRRHFLGIGNFMPGSILIVGDTPGKGAMGLNVPFVGTGSGQWLLDRLEEADIPEGRLCWINSKNSRGIKAEKDFIEAPYVPKAIICLGNNAFNWAAELVSEFKVIKVPHPQYWKRFQSGQPYPLIDILKELLQ